MAPAVHPCLRKPAMSSSPDAHSRDGAGAAAGVVMPELLFLGTAAEDGSPAEGDVVHSLTLQIAKCNKIKRDLTRKLKDVNKIKTVLNRKLKHARTKIYRLKQKAKAVRPSGPPSRCKPKRAMRRA